MSTENTTTVQESVFTPPVRLVELLFAVVLGASLIQFHELIFPPKLANPSFWAMFTAYLTAFLCWYGWHEAISAFPYRPLPISKLRSGIEALVVISYAYLLFAASRADISLLGYLWGYVWMFGLTTVGLFVRRREWGRPEASYQPIHLTVKHGLPIVVASIAYSIWELSSTPVPTTAIWIFVFVPLAVTLSYRWFLGQLGWRRPPVSTKAKE